MTDTGEMKAEDRGPGTIEVITHLGFTIVTSADQAEEVRRALGSPLPSDSPSVVTLREEFRRIVQAIKERRDD